MEVNSESNPLERKDAEGPSLDESLENKEHLDVDSGDSDSPKNVNNDLVSPSSRVLREEEFRGVESDLADSFEEGEIRGDSGDCDNVTTDDNEDAYLPSNALLDVNHGDPLCSRLLHQGKCHVTLVIAPEKDSIIAPPSTLPEYNIVVQDEEKFLYQQAKIEWLSDGDRNTKFFHVVLKGRTHRNRIDMVYDDKGERF
nr:RNA-directed DNA polymerase, eukaryota, reverse transcriptase zinc-binding domain protein [Tanacetum cinerariifolium]